MWDTPCPLARPRALLGRPGRMCFCAALLGRHGPRGLAGSSWCPGEHPLPLRLQSSLWEPPQDLSWQQACPQAWRGPKIAAGRAEGWHAESMRDRACLGGRACLCWPSLCVSKDFCLQGRERRWTFRASPTDPTSMPTHCLIASVAQMSCVDHSCGAGAVRLRSQGNRPCADHGATCLLPTVHVGLSICRNFSKFALPGTQGGRNDAAGNPGWS